MRLTETLLGDKSRQNFRSSTQVEDVDKTKSSVAVVVDKTREEIKTNI